MGNGMNKRKSRLLVGISLLVLVTATACTAPPVNDVRAKEPPQCKMGEQFICIGKSASRLKTDNETDHEICRCAQLNELPQMAPGRP